jgi:ABC-2 type transport system permease protein
VVAMLVLTSLFLGKMSGIQVEGHNIGTVTIEGAVRMRIAETCRRATSAPACRY